MFERRLIPALVACGLLIAACSGAAPTPQIVYLTPAPVAATPLPSVADQTPIAVPTVSDAPSVAPSQGPTGDASVVVVQTSLVKWIDVLGDANAQIIVKIQNQGGGWADMYASNSYTLYAKDGSVTSTGDFTYAYPRYLGPGKTGYLLDEADEDGGKVADFDHADISLDFNPVDGPGPILTTAHVSVRSGYFGDGVDVTGTVTDTSTDAVSESVIGAVLFDSSGRTLGFDYTNLVDNIGAGKTKGFTLGGDRDLKLSTVKSYLIFASSLD